MEAGQLSRQVLPSSGGNEVRLPAVFRFQLEKNSITHGYYVSRNIVQRNMDDVNSADIALVRFERR